MIVSLEQVIQFFEMAEFNDNKWVGLAPDPVTKACEDGCGPVGMRVPNACADGVFTDVGDGDGPPSSEYLRNAF